MSLKVMHYYTYPENAGGPLTYIENIMESEYFPQISFGVCYQGRPISQIRQTDIKRIVREIKAFSPDILHVHGVQSEGFLGVYVGRKAKVSKILMTVHGLQIDAQNISTRKRLVFERLIEPYALRNSNAVYCVCDAMTKRPFIQNNSKKLFPTIHNFITDRFMSSSVDELNIDTTGKIIVTTVGRVSFDKGMQELEKCIIADSNPNVQYWVIGSGEYEDEMKKNLAAQIENGKVMFWGQQKDVKAFLKKSDVFLFLSHHENLSVALLEAASQKCCCIATDVGGNSEVISHEVDGLLVSSMDVDAAIKALDSVINDSEYRQQLSEKIFDKLQSKFSEKEFSTRLSELYLSIV